MTPEQQQPWIQIVAAAREKRKDRAVSAGYNFNRSRKRSVRRFATTMMTTTTETPGGDDDDNDVDPEPQTQSLWGCGNSRGFVAVNVLKDFASGTPSLVKLCRQIEESEDRARLGGAMHVADVDTDYNTKAVADWKKKHMHCRHYHPGMCKTEHAAVLKDAHAMFLKLQAFLGPFKTGMQAGDTLMRFKCGEHFQFEILYFWLGFRLGNPRRQVFVATSNNSGATELMPCSVEIVLQAGGAMEMVHAHALMLQLLNIRRCNWEVAMVEYIDVSLQSVKATHVVTKAI